RGLVTRLKQYTQHRPSRAIRQSIDPLRMEMPLEGGNDIAGQGIVRAACLETVAVAGKVRLQLGDGGIGVAGCQHTAFEFTARRFDPEAHAGIGQQSPRKLLAGIDLARRRDVGMTEHAVRWYLMPL